MSLMRMLTKVAIGYAAAKGIDKVRRGGGLGSLLGGAKVAPDNARAGQMPGMEQLGGLMKQFTGAGSAGAGIGTGMSQLQDMMGNMAKSNGLDLSALFGGGSGAAPGDAAAGAGLLSASGNGAGIAGALSALGGAGAAGAGNLSGMFDQFSGKEVAPEVDSAAGLMLRAMIQAAKADGDIDAQEQAKILEIAGEDAEPTDMEFIKAQLNAPVDVQALAADTPPAQRMQVYSMSLMTIRLDTQAEAEYLDSLAAAMGLDQQTVNGLHLQMGVQPLYA